MEVQTQNYYAKNQKGEVLFRIELSNIEAFPWLRFACSLDVNFDRHPKIKQSIEELCSPKSTAEEKAMLLRKVILLIKRIEGVGDLYHKSTKAKPEPDLFKGIQGILDIIFEQDDFREYVPFSKTHNAYFFKILRNKIARPQQLAQMREVDRSSFEDLIKGHTKLESEYVNYFSKDAAFYVYSIKIENTTYEFYFMKTDEIRLIFFIEES